MATPLEHAELLLERGRYDLARREAERALAQDAECAAAHELIALCAAQQKDHPVAIQHARTAIALQPASPRSHLCLAYALCESSEPSELSEAERAVRESVRLAPNEPNAHAITARLLLRSRRPEDALAAAEVGLRLAPNHVGCAVQRVAALIELGRSADARDETARLLQIDPENPDFHAVRGWSLLSAKDSDQASDHFQESLRRNPQSHSAQRGLVETLRRRDPAWRSVVGMLRRPDRSRASAAYWICLIIAIVLTRGIVLFGFVVFVLGGAWFGAAQVSLAHTRTTLRLRLHRQHRHLLSAADIVASNLVLGILAASATALGCAFIWRSGAFVIASVVLFGAHLSAFVAIHRGRGSGRALRVTLGCLLLLLGLSAAIAYPWRPEHAQVVLGLWLIGVPLSCWLSSRARN